jgi:NQR2, RnfD, RnfE family
MPLVLVGNPVSIVRQAPAFLRRFAVAPESVAPALLIGVALLPPVVVGLVLFRVVALEMLGVAVVAAGAAHVAQRLLRWPGTATPGLAAVVGVALVGPRAPLPWTAAIAATAAGLELARSRYVAGARLQAGVLAYALVLLVSRGAPAAYGSPGSLDPMAESIRFWLQSSGGGPFPIDPVRLYVGNVAGPVFATSLLAVAVGAAWLWYSRRLSLLAVLAVLAGALVPIQAQHWSAGYQLLSGPLWFVAALVLADRRTLPSSPVGRPLLGVATGAIAVGARARGFAIEAVPVTVAAVQVLAATMQGAAWLNRNRQVTASRLRELRDAVHAPWQRRPDRTAG